MDSQKLDNHSINEEKEGDDDVNVHFHHGSIVMATVAGYPPWPAMVDVCPDTGDIFWLENYKDLSKKNASHYHVAFFDVKVSRSWVHERSLKHYRSVFPESVSKKELENMSKLKVKERRLLEARLIAEQALEMSMENRRAKYSFMNNFKGKITLFDDDGNKQVIAGRKVKKARTSESSKKNDRPGRRSKSSKVTAPCEENKNEVPEEAKKVAPIRIRRKPGPKPRKDLPDEYETYTTSERRLSSTSSASSIPPEKEVIHSKRTRRSSYQIVPAASTSAKPSSEPKPRGRKPKSPGKKRTWCVKRTSKKVPTEDAPSVESQSKPPETSISQPLTCTPSASSTPLISELVIEEVNQSKDPSNAVALRRPKTNELNREPSENSMANLMTSLLSRIQNQTPNPQHNSSYGKTISNLNLLVAKTEEGAVVDLTGDDDEECKWNCGDVVLANLKGLQPWPAMILEDPEINVCFIPNLRTPNYVHVYFFSLNRRAWVPVENVGNLEESGRHSETAEMLNYNKFCKAMSLAHQARRYSREQRPAIFANARDVPMTGVPAVQLSTEFELK